MSDALLIIAIIFSSLAIAIDFYKQGYNDGMKDAKLISKQESEEV